MIVSGKSGLQRIDCILKTELCTEVSVVKYRLVSGFLLLSMFASAFAADATQVRKPVIHEQKFTKGLLWQISKAGTPAGYVFGTIHSDDARVTNISPEVKEALSKSLSFSLDSRSLMMVLMPRDLQTSSNPAIDSCPLR